MSGQRNSPLNYALMLLKIRDRGSQEIRVRMQRKGFIEEEIVTTIRFLEEQKLLDDRKFAENYLKSQLARSPQGKRRLYAKLKQTHLPNDIINEALNDIDSKTEAELAKEAAEHWLERNNNVPEEEIKPKLSRYLAGRGFGWDTVGDIIDRIGKK